MTDPNDLDPVQVDVPLVERSTAAPSDQQSASSPPVRMTGFDRGRMTRAAVELMLRRID